MTDIIQTKTSTEEQATAATIAHVRSDLSNLTPLLVSSKIEQQQLMMQSAAAGGPASFHEAIDLLLDMAEIGIRPLSVEVGIGRKKLQAMIEGRTNMPPEIITKIWDAIERKKPGMLDKLVNTKVEDIQT